VVGPLVAGIEELAGGIKIEAARIISTRPFVADKAQLAGFADRENANTVVQTIAGVNEAAIARNQDLGAEVTAGESGRQTGDGLPRGQPPLRGIVVEEDDGGAFLLDGIAPTSVGVE